MMKPGWDWARNEVEKRIGAAMKPKLITGPRGKKTTVKPNKVPYRCTWSRGEGADPQLFVTLETTAEPGVPLDDPNLIEMMIYLKRNGWVKMENA
jgi:hypothetical protein